jgi:hypothetical protein
MNRTEIPLPSPILIGFAILTGLLAACGPTRKPAEAFIARLPDAVVFEIVALDPFIIDYGKITGDERDHMYGYQVIGRATIDDIELRREITRLVESGMSAEDIDVDACFNPRHGIRADLDGHTIEVVICYQCRSLQIYEDGQFKSGHSTSDTPSTEMNAIWERAGCQVAE